MSFRTAALVGLFLVGAGARASTIFGNPAISVSLDSGDPVEVLGVRGYTCPGQVTDDFEEELSVGNPVVGTLPSDDYCGLAVGVRWDPTEGGVTVVVDDVDDVTLASGQATLTIVLDPVSRTASLQ